MGYRSRLAGHVGGCRSRPPYSQVSHLICEGFLVPSLDTAVTRPPTYSTLLTRVYNGLRLPGALVRVPDARFLRWGWRWDEQESSSTMCDLRVTRWHIWRR
jgi:hypothetical protein